MSQFPTNPTFALYYVLTQLKHEINHLIELKPEQGFLIKSEESRLNRITKESFLRMQYIENHETEFLADTDSRKTLDVYLEIETRLKQTQWILECNQRKCKRDKTLGLNSNYQRLEKALINIQTKIKKTVELMQVPELHPNDCDPDFFNLI